MLSLAPLQRLAAAGASGGLKDPEILSHYLPLKRVGVGAASREDEFSDHRPGQLRVRIIEAEGLPNRLNGSSCQPYVTVAVTELTRRRVKRTSIATPSNTMRWDDAFEFEDTSASAQVIPCLAHTECHPSS